MRCPNCHQIISQSNVFCPYCGTKLSNVSNQSVGQSNNNATTYQSLNNIQTSIDNVKADIRRPSLSKSFAKGMGHMSLISQIGISCIVGVFVYAVLMFVLGFVSALVFPGSNNVSVCLWIGGVFTVGLVVYMASRSSVVAKAYSRKQAVINELRRKYEKIYTHTLAPASYGHIRVNMPSYDSQLLGGNQINYMFFTTGKYSEHIVTFPESKYGNRIKYYLLNVRFTPKYDTVTSGYSYADGKDYTYEGFLGGLHTIRSPEEYSGSSSKQEIPSTALLTLTPTDFSRTIRIRLKDAYKSNIDFIIQEGLLGGIDKRRVLKAEHR